MLVGAYTDLFASPISWTTTFLSLIAIMVFTMVMQIKDDVKRHMNDAKVDARDAESIKGKTIWKDVKVGDIMGVIRSSFLRMWCFSRPVRKEDLVTSRRVILMERQI